MIAQEKVHEETVKWVGSRPLSFEEFLEGYGPKDCVELIDGVVVEQSMVQLEHEKLFGWLHTVMSLYVGELGLGIVLGSPISSSCARIAWVSCARKLSTGRPIS
jgi:Uma2 family endonuclease